MHTGKAIHIGLSKVDANLWPGLGAPGCAAAATDMSSMTTGLGYASNVVLTDNAATKPAVTAAFRAAIDGLSENDMLCLSYAGHGVAYDNSTGTPQVVFMMYDQPWRRGEFLQLLTAINKPLRIVVAVLACYGPISAALSEALGIEIRRSGFKFTRVLPDAQARQFWQSSAGWESWARAYFAFTVDSAASVLIVASSHDKERSQGAMQGVRLPAFTSALIEGVPTSANYPALVGHIAQRTQGSGSTPVLNKSLVRPDDECFELTKPFSLP